MCQETDHRNITLVKISAQNPSPSGWIAEFAAIGSEYSQSTQSILNDHTPHSNAEKTNPPLTLTTSTINQTEYNIKETAECNTNKLVKIFIQTKSLVETSTLTYISHLFSPSSTNTNPQIHNIKCNKYNNNSFDLPNGKINEFLTKYSNLGIGPAPSLMAVLTW